MRFYSLFICASAAFILATINFVDEKKTIPKRAAVLIAGLFLLFSHFLGILALCAQSVVAVLASKSKWPKWRQLAVAFGLLLVMGLPLIPFVQQKLWQFYAAHAGVTDFSVPAINKVSTVNFVKAAFAGYTFVFGYHVYPLRLVLVTVGLLLCGLLVTVGTVRLWRESRWRMLPLIYLLTIFAVYFVLNSIGGRVASVIGPRHGAFVWPVFIILLAIGLNSFRNPVFHALLASLLAISVLSIWFGWKKDWTYGPTEDYRSAAEYASRWTTKDSALLTDGRSAPAVDFYFPRNTPRINSSPNLQDGDLISQLRNQRLIFVTDDWGADRRRGFDRLLAGLNEKYAYIDGRVDYPLFEYVLERKSSAETSGYPFFRDGNQLRQPLSIYGLEFQDLQLPISLKVKDLPLTVIGGYGLPDLEGRRDLSLPLTNSKISARLILLTNVVGSSGLPASQPVAEVVIEDKAKKTLTFSLRLGRETTSWDKQCERAAPCETVFQWHKRLAIVGQSKYEGALRDFPAGLHGVVLDLPPGIEVGTVSFHYVAPSGQLYIWELL